jgi:predicted RNA-binding Zn ribbon-like protein
MKLDYNYPNPLQDGEWAARFIFIAGRLSIDFTQTGGSTPVRAYWERLHAPQDLSDWFAISPLRLEGVAVTLADFDSALKLREAIFRAAEAIRAEQAPDPDDIETINRAAAQPDLAPQLGPDGKDENILASGSGSASAALSTIARDAIDLFTGELRTRIRQCENPQCQLMFVDQSRPGKRRWCLMERCGNLHKTRRYRRRQAEKTEK